MQVPFSRPRVKRGAETAPTTRRRRRVVRDLWTDRRRRRRARRPSTVVCIQALLCCLAVYSYTSTATDPRPPRQFDETYDRRRHGGRLFFLLLFVFLPHKIIPDDAWLYRNSVLYGYGTIYYNTSIFVFYTSIYVG